ncbi:MAG: ATP-binding protein [Cucumibacter sp.]
MTALKRNLLDVFEIECREHLEAVRRILARAGEDARDGGALLPADLTEATRRVHSLKGAARAIGLEHVEAVSHRLESLFLRIGYNQGTLDGEVIQLVGDALDNIEDKVEAMYRGASPQAPASTPANPVPVDATAPGADRAAASQNGSVRVDAENLDRLLKSAGELHTDMLFQQVGAQEVTRLGREATAFEVRWSRVWKQIETGLKVSAAGAELARALGGGQIVSAELKGISRRLQHAARQQNSGARSFRHHLDDLERRVKGARMMPAESVFGSFRKMVRDIATSEGKEVEVVIDGLDCQADRLVLQRIKDPVMHMLRNAVSHGIESPQIRQQAGKPPRGMVALRIASGHDRLRLVIEDNGRGLDFKAIADEAARQGRMTPLDAEVASPEALSQLLFEPGFSTAESVTTISGRGVGLSVAREAVNGLQGKVEIGPRPGGGTRIEVSVPVSILSRRLLLVTFRDQIYALPSESVARAIRVPAERIVSIEGRPAVRLPDSTLPLVSLGEILKLADPRVAFGAAGVCVIVVRATGGPLGVAVDGFVGVNDFVVRNFDLGHADTRLCAGIIST